jgi:hypothetical protein
MKNDYSLEQTLAANLPWHKARTKYVAAFLLALVSVKNVNLVEIACAFAGRAKQESNYIGDREFIGKSWLQWLRQQGIEFRMRIHENYLVANGRGQFVPAWRLFAHSGIDTPLVIP